MLTPSFDVSQDDSFVTITLRVPYVKISEAEIHYEGCEFRFYCKPYFLHLHLPGQLASDGCEKSSYDVDTGTLLIHLPKRDKGQVFPNLGMLTTLLPRKPSCESGAAAQPVIEMLGEETRAGEEEEEEEEVYDWRVEQTITSENETNKLLTGLQPYGFARKHRGVFLKLKEAGSVIADCPDPDHMTLCERRLARLAHEEASFSQDHYLADLMDNEYIETLLVYEPPWKSKLVQWQTRMNDGTELGPEKEPGPDIVPFSSTQRDQLKGLPNREYLLDKAMKRWLYLGLVDIIYSYAYQNRTTEGESNVESSWTLCRLSSTLCWLEEFHGSVHEVIHTCIRRTLCYPLYRHWRLALTVLQDTRDLFRLGRRQLLSCLLECIATTNTCDPYYLLNDLYFTDYAIWLQTASVKQIQSLAEELDEVKLEPGHMGWELQELEEAARLVAAEQEGGPSSTGLASGGEDTLEALTNQMQATHLESKPLIEEVDTCSSRASSRLSGSAEGTSSEEGSASSCTSESNSEDSNTGKDSSSNSNMVAMGAHEERNKIS